MAVRAQGDTFLLRLADSFRDVVLLYRKGVDGAFVGVDDMVEVDHRDVGEPAVGAGLLGFVGEPLCF